MYIYIYIYIYICCMCIYLREYVARRDVTAAAGLTPAEVPGGLPGRLREELRDLGMLRMLGIFRIEDYVMS